MLLLARRLLLFFPLLLMPLFATVKGVQTKEFKQVKIVPQATIDNVYRELVAQGISQPEIVIRQVIAETRWLKCKECSMKFNNLFGFLTKSGYMKFDNWTESVAYYKQWQDQLYTGGDYYSFLQHVGYATAPNYIRLLKQIDPSEFI